MRTGDKVKVIKEFDYGVVTLEEGDILTVGNYIHKRKVYLKCNGVVNLIPINYEDIDKYIELVDCQYSDPLAELEAVALEHYLAKGYKLSEDQEQNDPSWHFEVQFITQHKKKLLNVVLFVGINLIEKDSYIGKECETTKEMFDNAIKHFKG